MENLKDLSIKIMEALKPILPKGTGFIMVYGDTQNGELNVAGNLPDQLSIEFLEAAVSTIITEPAIILDDPEKRNEFSN